MQKQDETAATPASDLRPPTSDLPPPASDPQPNASVWDLPVPDGYMRNAAGHLVHASQIQPADQMRHELICDLVIQASARAAEVSGFFNEAYKELLTFCQISAERFGTLWGETDSFTMSSLCGRFKVTCDCDTTVALNETVVVAKNLLDECIADWMIGGKPQAVALVKDTFRPNRNGGISIGRLFALLRHKNADAFKDDARFQRVCEAIECAIQPTGKRRYIRFYARRTPADKWQMVEFGW